MDCHTQFELVEHVHGGTCQQSWQTILPVGRSYNMPLQTITKAKRKAITTLGLQASLSKRFKKADY